MTADGHQRIPKQVTLMPSFRKSDAKVTLPSRLTMQPNESGGQVQLVKVKLSHWSWAITETVRLGPPHVVDCADREQVTTGGRVSVIFKKLLHSAVRLKMSVATQVTIAPLLASTSVNDRTPSLESYS